MMMTPRRAVAIPVGLEYSIGWVTGRRRAGKALGTRGPRSHPECGFPCAVRETVTLTPSPAELRGRLPELMPRDQRRLGRRVENAAALRDAGAREQALGQVITELEAAAARLEARRRAVPVVSYPPALPVS